MDDRPLPERLHDAIDRGDYKEAHKLADEMTSKSKEAQNDLPSTSQPTKKSGEFFVTFFPAILIVLLGIFGVAYAIWDIVNSKEQANVSAPNLIAIEEMRPESICTTDEQRELLKKYPPEKYWLIFERRENRDVYGAVTASGYFIYPISRESAGKTENHIRMENNSENNLFIKQYQNLFCRAYTIHDWNTGQIPNYQYHKTFYYDQQASDYGVIITGNGDGGMRVLFDKEVIFWIRYRCTNEWYSKKDIRNEDAVAIRNELGIVHLNEIGGWVIQVPSYSGRLGLFIPQAFDFETERSNGQKDPRFYVSLDKFPAGYYGRKNELEPVLDRNLAKSLTGYAVEQKIGDARFVVIYASRSDYEAQYRLSDDRRVSWPRYRLAKELENFSHFGSFELPLQLPEKKEY